MATPGALAAIPPQDLVERIYNGAIPSHLAEELGVAKSSIYRHLADHPDYQHAKHTGMAVRLDDAELAVSTATECTLPRAREMWRCVTWRAEREHAGTWGAKQQLDVRSVNVEIKEYVVRIANGALHTEVLGQSVQIEQTQDADV